MGNRSSWQTVSQNSTGNEEPCFLSMLKRESNALHPTSRERESREEVICQCSQTSYFEVFSVHYDVIETEQHREPILDHRIVDTMVLWASSGKTTLWRVQHDRNDASEHGNREETDLLVLADLAKVGDAYCQVCKGAVSDDGYKVFLVQAGDDLKRGVRDSFCSRWLGLVSEKSQGHVPVKTLDAAEKTPNIVRQPERIFWTRA